MSNVVAFRPVPRELKSVRPVEIFNATINPHLANLRAFFGHAVPSPPPYLDNVQILFVCYTNRSGSNFLCEALSSTGVYNMGQELLNWTALLKTAVKLRAHSLDELLEMLIRPQIRDGRFVMKVSCAHIEVLVKCGLMAPVMPNAQFVHVERADRLAQAISFEIAAQTSAWTSLMTQKSDSAKQLVYSRKQLAKLVRSFADQNRLLDVFFGLNGITPAHVLYERLVIDPQLQVSAVGQLVGLQGLAMDRSQMRLERQATSINKEWRARFLAGE